MKDIIIGKHSIGALHRPFIVAEMSGNHNHSLDRALTIVDAAARTGAHALKMQTYTADTMTLEVDAPGFVIEDKESLWKGKSLHQLYTEAYTPWEWHKPIFERCRSLGMVCFSTPFDETAVDFLESFDVPCYKIASFENTCLSLIRKVAATKKPLIISTGMATVTELDEAVQTARAAGCTDLILLRCTSTYPATPEDSNLLTIPHLQALFDCMVGLSDHTLGSGVAIASVALGACLIEKHFTLARAAGGVDSAFSMEPAEMANLVVETERAWQAMGTITYGPTAAEKKSLAFRRSIYVSRDIRAGEYFSSDNIRIVRPGYGLPPKFYDIVLGRKARSDIRKGTALDWNLVE